MELGIATKQNTTNRPVYQNRQASEPLQQHTLIVRHLHFKPSVHRNQTNTYNSNFQHTTTVVNPSIKPENLKNPEKIKNNSFGIKFNFLFRVRTLKPKPLYNEAQKLSMEDIFNRYKKFDIEDYSKLSNEETNTIRNSLSAELKDDRNILLMLGKSIKKEIKKMYPDKELTLVFFGKKNSMLGETLNIQRDFEVKCCPMINLEQNYINDTTNLISEIPSQHLEIYNKYLDSINLSSKKIANSNRTYVFVVNDYSSIENLKTLLERPEIGIKSDNVNYKRLYSIIYGNENGDMKKTAEVINLNGLIKTKRQLVHEYMTKSSVFNNLYSTIDIVPRGFLDKIEKALSMQQTLESKQMHFTIIDYIQRHKALRLAV